MDRSAFLLGFKLYTAEDVELIVKRGARVLGIGVDGSGARKWPGAGRGTQRFAGRLLRRTCATRCGGSEIDHRELTIALFAPEVDFESALSVIDRVFDSRRHFGGRDPSRHRDDQAALSEPRDTIEDDYRAVFFFAARASSGAPRARADATRFRHPHLASARALLRSRMFGEGEADRRSHGERDKSFHR